MTGGTLRDAAHAHGGGERALNDSLMQLMAPPNTTFSLGVGPGRREYPLPRPFAMRVRQLAREAVRQRSTMNTCTQILLKLQLHTVEMDAKCRYYGTRQRNAAISVTLAGANQDLAPLEIDVLDPQTKTLGDAETTAVHQCGA